MYSCVMQSQDRNASENYLPIRGVAISELDIAAEDGVHILVSCMATGCDQQTIDT